jgi:hypothetical protein
MYKSIRFHFLDIYFIMLAADKVQTGIIRFSACAVLSIHLFFLISLLTNANRRLRTIPPNG